MYTYVMVLQAPTITHPYPPSGTSSMLTGGGARGASDAPPDSVLNDSEDNSMVRCSVVAVLMVKDQEKRSRLERVRFMKEP